MRFPVNTYGLLVDLELTCPQILMIVGVAYIQVSGNVNTRTYFKRNTLPASIGITRHDASITGATRHINFHS